MNKSSAGAVAGLAGLLLAIVVALLFSAGALDRLELASYDLRFRGRGPQPPRDDIILVTIDPETLRDLKRKTTAIYRHEHGQVIAELVGRGVDLVVYDMDFSSPSQDENEDYYLQQVLSENPGRVILANYIAQNQWVRPNEMFRQAAVAVGQWEFHGTTDHEGGINVSWEPGEEADGYAVFYSTEYITDPYAEEVAGPVSLEGDAREVGLEGLFPDTEYHFLILGHSMSQLLAREGSINYLEDKDDRIRRMPLLPSVPGQERHFETLSLATAITRLWPQGGYEECPGAKNEICLRGNGQELVVPTVDGNLLINYAGPRGTFPSISFSKLLPEHMPDNMPDLKGKIALVGNTHPTAHDEYPTPFAGDKGRKDTEYGYTSGLEIHANALATILERDFIRVEGKGMVLLSIIALGLALTLIWSVIRAFSIGGIVVLLAALGGTVFTAQYLFQSHNYWLTATPLIMVIALDFLGVMVVQTLFEYREKQFIKGAFGMYLAPAVIDQLLKDPDRLNLGGEEREMTALFSDVQGFSAISEKLGPKDLVHLLNEYLTPMCDAIFKFEGTVDKFEGDAIIAFFGAPIPHADDARRACAAALEMQRQNQLLNQRLAAEGRPQLITRIGINSGPMVVGNMGSEQRMDYTVMGDAVNLASRLEGANKQYGSLLLISEDTYSLVKDGFEARELDLITVMGKEKPVRVYELMAEKGGLDPKTLEAVAEFAKGLELYRGLQFDQAIQRFEKVIEIRGDDPPSRAYIERSREFKHNPPAQGWDGVYRLKSK